MDPAIANLVPAVGAFPGVLPVLGVNKETLALNRRSDKFTKKWAGELGQNKESVVAYDNMRRRLAEKLCGWSGRDEDSLHGLGH